MPCLYGFCSAITHASFTTFAILPPATHTAIFAGNARLFFVGTQVSQLSKVHYFTPRVDCMAAYTLFHRVVSGYRGCNFQRPAYYVTVYLTFLPRFTVARLYIAMRLGLCAAPRRFVRFCLPRFGFCPAPCRTA